jgi:serine/threonine protein kinase
MVSCMISEKYTAYIIKQLIEGIRHLHMNAVFHRDIKPENILMENVKCFDKVGYSKDLRFWLGCSLYRHEKYPMWYAFVSIT